MEEGQPELELSAKEEPKKRKIVIETDGIHVNIVSSELSVLEVKEIARMILKQSGG